MSKKTTTPTTPAPAAAVVFTGETLRKAADLAAAAYQPVWTGPSGEESSGEVVARHLEATIAMLDKDGWTRTTSTDWSSSATLADIDSMTVEAMVRQLLLLVRDEISSDPRRTLFTALRNVGESDHGDTDTRHVAGEILTLMVRAHTGSDAAQATAWSERLHRTHADITALLTAAAVFARAYGPGAAAPEAPATA